MARTTTFKKNGNLFRILKEINDYCTSKPEDFPNYSMAFSMCYPRSFSKPEVNIHLRDSIVTKEQLDKISKYANDVTLVNNHLIIQLEQGKLESK